MNYLQRNVTAFRIVRLRNKHWLLNVFLIKANASEVISQDTVFQIIETHLSEIDNEYMSDEFEYFKTGFAFLHYGNRGVDLTIWHVGKWGNTFEVFSESWYCYNRDIHLMSILDHAEPVICQYELSLMCEELTAISMIIKNMNDEDIFQDAFYQKHIECKNCIAPDNH